MKKKTKLFLEETESLLTVKPPLTMLAQQLQPKVAIVRIEQVNNDGYVRVTGDSKLFRVVVNFGGGERELSGYSSDEFEVFKQVKQLLGAKGYAIKLDT